MLPAESWDMIRARQRRATFPRDKERMIDKRKRVYQAFGAYLVDFIRDLNHRSEDGWSLLVEGPRDERALRKLGYGGVVVTISHLGRAGPEILGEAGRVMILTDLDREGTVLAARFVKRLSHDGLKTSLRERGRLRTASRGVFLHIENLSRFAQSEVLSS